MRTAELFDRRDDGKALGLDSETIVLEARSNVVCQLQDKIDIHSGNAYLPLFWVPQISQVRMVLASPVDSLRRFPQSTQNINDPIADIVMNEGD